MQVQVQELKKNLKPTSAHIPTDIVEYAKYRGYKLTSDQIKVLRSVLTNKPTIVHAGHSIGKSVLAALLACYFFDHYTDGIGIVTAPTARQINDIIFRNMREIMPNSPYFAPKASVLYRNSSSWVKGLATNSGESYQGLHCKGGLLVIFDEAEGIDQIYWQRAFSMYEPNKKGHFFLAISNPYSQSSPFYLEAQKGIYEVLNISALNHPNVTMKEEVVPGAITYATVKMRIETDCRIAEVHEAHKSWKFEDVDYVTENPLFDIQIRGHYPQQSEFSLYNEQDLINIQQNLPDDADYFVSIGCDVARYGLCATVFCVRRGPNIVELLSYKGFSIVQTANKIKELCNKYATKNLSAFKIPCFIDGTGLGAGVVDLKGDSPSDTYNFVEVLSSRKPSEDKEIYVKNMRSELWVRARNLVRAKQVSIAMIEKNLQNQLMQEIKLPEFSIDLQGKTVVESKDDMVKRLGRSPDLADAFNLSLMTPLASFESHFK